VTITVLHLLVPAGAAEPARASGGNTYDLRLASALREQGAQVRVGQVDGGWPWRPGAGAGNLERALARLPDDATVVVDGLLASRLPHVMARASDRLRVVLLVHLPAGVDEPPARPAERQVVDGAAAVLTPSAWCRDWLVGEYGVDPARVHVARPGVDPAPVSPGTTDGASLLTVGAVSGVKGQDRLLAALAALADLPWRWTCVGSTTADPTAAAHLRRTADALGLADRVDMAGVLGGPDLVPAWSGADLLVVPSRTETYGMVVTEALARGLPVVAMDVGGVREAMGTTSEAGRPGLLVPAGDGAALATALRRWLTDAPLRESLRAAARARRRELGGWADTAARVADVVRDVAS
jgi:glycosyltransferase involved in cell wall biosynthesis